MIDATQSQLVSQPCISVDWFPNPVSLSIGFLTLHLSWGVGPRVPVQSMSEGSPSGSESLGYRRVENRIHTGT